MARHSFITKNTLGVSTYFFIVLMFLFLLILFITIGNLNTVVSRTNLDGHVEAAEHTAVLLARDADSIEADIRAAASAGSVLSDSGTVIGFWGSGKTAGAIKTQLDVMKVQWTDVAGIFGEVPDCLFIERDELTVPELERLELLCSEGTSIVFLAMPQDRTVNSTAFKNLTGIRSVLGTEKYDGIRITNKMLLGTMLEDNEKKVNAYSLKLSRQTKVYVAALPEGYEKYKTYELPPLVWRYIAGRGYGGVYVCNGDCMYDECCYSIAPLVIQETQGSLIYPIVNAYCAIVTGFPYADNFTTPTLTRLYSRDAKLVQQDLFLPQLRRYSQIYNTKLTCFSPDYDAFQSGELTKELEYCLREIQAAQGIIARDEGERLYLQSETDNTEVEQWDTDFSFWNSDEGKYFVPVNFRCDEVRMPDVFDAASMINAFGFYSVNLDYGALLRYEGTRDIWIDYCSIVEVVLGTQLKNYGWLERVDMAQALARIDRVMRMKTNVRYFEDGIVLSVDNFEDEAWFLLHTSNEYPTIDNGTVEKIGDGCYLVTLKEAEAAISWGKGK